MKALPSIYAALLALLAFSATTNATKPPSSKAVLLSNIQSLTLRKDKLTTHRRVSAIPQLKCVGGNGRGKFDVDIMRCTNAGSSYDDANVEWSCTASLPPEFKLGSTDVICEGYSGPEDPYVLKGSCGVEYRLILTDQGEEKYGKGWFGGGSGGGEKLKDKLRGGTMMDTIVVAVFWLLFAGVLAWMLYSYCVQQGRNGRGRANPRPPRGGGGGGGGGFWGGGDDDPPPPYDYQPPRGKPSYPRSSSQGWRPGFWSGAGAGAAAGYAAGRAGGNRSNGTSSWGGQGGSMWDRGEGSSRGSSSNSNSSAPSSSRYTSTGFGSSTRR
ncbi:DUF1183-domain-containing protein [Rhizodiscina lignyota]|uniref:Store-operated calcium entry-associated regulatory factor n=1 Tax=Rhizodiscina lignyota TaxID=1504668 RepID=A0A9P4M6Q1_9PEZI|nr:DUF1183-domain-containing protein [Rhizodiscina lignyota]